MMISKEDTMKKLVIVLVIQVSLMHAQNRENVFPVLQGPYLGQKPPGVTPEVFAPGIVSTGLYTRDITMTKDGSEIYFCVSDASVTAIFVTKLIDKKWTEPAIASFSGTGFFDFEPHISPDGTKFFFLSNRPPHNQKPGKGWFYQNIWMMTKTNDGWSEPQLVDEPISTEENEFFPSVTNDNVLYFSRSTKSGQARIYRSKFENGRYEKPEALPFALPEKGMLFNAFVSPKEDFLVTCAVNIDSTNADQDYYVSFRSAEGKWSSLIKFAPDINTPGDNANSAYVSPDGKYLFFSSSRKNSSKPEIRSGSTLRAIIDSKAVPGTGSSAIFWVSAEVIQELKPKGWY
jgi:hypothetical protein